MVLGILTSIAACPAIIGTTEAVRQGQKQNARQGHRGRKMNLAVTCSDPSRKARDLHGGTVVLRNKRVSLKFLRGASARPQKRDRTLHCHYNTTIKCAISLVGIVVELAHLQFKLPNVRKQPKTS